MNLLYELSEFLSRLLDQEIKSYDDINKYNSLTPKFKISSKSGSIRKNSLLISKYRIDHLTRDGVRLLFLCN